MAGLLLVPLALAGCGGGTHYSKDRTAACLIRKGVTVMFPTDGIASANRGLGVMVAARNLNITFGKSPDQARELVREYAHGQFRSLGERRLSARIYRKANAVLAWDVPPAAARGSVEHCLS